MAHQKKKYTSNGVLCVSCSDFSIHEEKVVNKVVDKDSESQLPPMEYEMRLTSTINRREQNKLVRHNALRFSLQKLERVTVHGFLNRSNNSDVWNCFLTVVPNCVDIPEAKNLFTVKNRL